MRELSSRVQDGSGLLHHAASKTMLFPLRENWHLIFTPLIRALILTAAAVFLTSIDTDAQYTLSKIDPTCQVKDNGQITLSNLAPSTTYTIDAVAPGTTIPATGSYTTNAAGQFVFGQPIYDLTQGLYTFTIGGFTPASVSINLYDLSKPSSVAASVACMGQQSWINPFHNDETEMHFTCDNVTTGTSTNTTYLNAGTSSAGAGITSAGFVAGCMNQGCSATNWSTSISPTSAYGTNDFYEFNFTVGALKYDMTNIDFLWNRDANGPKRWAVYIDGALINNANTDLATGCQTVSIGETRTFQPGQTVQVRIVGYNAAANAGSLIIDEVVISSNIRYNFYTDAALTTLAPGGNEVDSLQTPALAGPITYYIQGLANGGCLSDTVQFTVSPAASPAPTITATPSATFCAGGSASLTVTPTVMGETYLWSNATTSQSISVNTAGTYTATVTNSAGCTATATQTITVNTPTQATISGTTTICSGTSTTLSASAGTSWSWSTMATSQSISTGTAGTYTVTVTDANGCTSSASATIVVNQSPTASINANPNTNQICAGASATLTASGGTGFMWSTGALTTGITVTPAIQTVYTVTVTAANGCTSSASTTINVNPLPTVVITPSIPSGNFCIGSSITLTASGANTYAWSPGGQTGAAITVNPASSTVYTVTGTDTNGCTGTATFSVTVLPLPTVAFSGTTTICNGSSTIITASGGSAYNWSTGSTIASTTVSPASTTTYTVTVSNATCSTTASVTVMVLPVPVAGISGDLDICIGQNTMLTANGGGTYNWGGGVTTAFYSVSPIATTTYTVTVTGANGCTSTSSATVVVNPLPTVAIVPTSASICLGTMTTLTATGGTSYTWSNLGTTPAISVSPIANTTYTVTATDSNGCTNTASTPVTVLPLPVVTITPPVQLCQFTSTTVTVTGGGTYLWNNMSTGASITVSSGAPNTTTNYSVTVTGTNGCTASTSTSITTNPVPVVTIPNNSPICLGTTAMLTAMPAPPGHTYLWSTNATTQSISVSPSANTNYTVTVTTSAGCSNNATAMVTVLPIPIITFSGDNNICIGETTTITASGGVGYAWSNGSATSELTVSPVATTTYTVTVTGANSCTSTANHTIIVNPLPVASIQPTTTIVCANSTLALTATGGGTYQWSPNAGSSTNATVTVTPVTPPATYIVTVTSAAGCTATASRIITVVDAPVATISAPNTSICKGSNITLTASGGSTYQWSNGTNAAANQVSPGITTTYTVTVTNVQGCTDTESITIDVRIAPVVTGVASAPSCVNGNDGSILLDVTAGMPISTYTWTTGNGSGIVQGHEDQYTLNPGTYVVVVSNAASCDVMLMFTVPIAPANNDHTPPSITCDSITVSCVMQNLTPTQLNNLGVVGAIPTVSDNCAPLSAITLTNLVTNEINLGCNDVINGLSNISYVVDLTWTAKDNNGNDSSCVQRIYYERVNNDDIHFPNDTTLFCPNANTVPNSTGTPYITYLGHNYALWPNVGYCELTIDTLERIVPICSGSYKIERTWKVLNWCEPNFNHIQYINVMDTTAPIFVCPAPLTVSTSAQDCFADIDLPNVILDDACSSIKSFQASWTTGGMSMNLPGTLTTFPGNNLWLPDTLGVMGIANDLPVGTTSITYTVRDDCNNVATCSFNITVVDNIPPTAQCKSGFAVSLSSSVSFMPATSINDGSFDNCSPVYFKARRMDANTCSANNKFYDKVEFCCDDKNDTVMVILRVYDIPVPSGPVDLTFEEIHSNDCMTSVIISDKLKPTCIAPANVTVDCDSFDPTLWSYGHFTAVDNCMVSTKDSTVNYSSFDTQCTQGDIIRSFHATDMSGLSCTASFKITVRHVQDYFVKFPDDVNVVQCNGTFTAGAPIIYDEDCELGGTSVIDVDTVTTTTGACYEVIKTWRVLNLCTYNPTLPCTIVPNPNPSMLMGDPANLPGPVVAPASGTFPGPTTIRILPTDLAPTNYSTFWTANANCYEYKQRIKVSDDVAPTFVNCPTTIDTTFDLSNNDPQLWNEMYWWDNLHMTHNLGEAPVELPAAAIDACSGTKLTMTYQLFLDLDGNGLMETVINSANPPAPGTVLYNNASTPNFAGGTVRTFDERPVPVSQKYQFALEQAVIGGNLMGFVRWNTIAAPSTYYAPQLPYGTHKVKWFVHDGCGNQSICEYTFTIVDDKAPTTFLVNGLSTNMMPTGMAMINLADFLVKAPTDNMSDSSQIKLSFQIAPAGTTFPVDINGNPITQLSVQCPTVGQVNLVIWAMDLAGNMSTNMTYILVQDPNGFCAPAPSAGNKVTVAGSLDGKDNTGGLHGVQGVDVQISGTHPTLPPLQASQITNQTGKYSFATTIPTGGNYMVTPVKNDDALNGVNILDVLLMQRHILGLDPLNTPYKIIAADVNKSGSITSTDIVELRKLILGYYTELPNNKSWRFVDKAYQFSNPFNPFADNFNEYVSWQNIQTNQDSACFAAVKVGDLNNSAVYNSLMQSDDRSASTLYFETSDRTVTTGEVFDVPFSLSEVVKGYQFTLNYEGLTLEEVIPTDRRFTQDFYAVFADSHALTFACDLEGKTGFTLRFRANKAGKISSMIHINSRITKALASGTNGTSHHVNARFMVIKYKMQHLRCIKTHQTRWAAAH